MCIYISCYIYLTCVMHTIVYSPFTIMTGNPLLFSTQHIYYWALEKYQSSKNISPSVLTPPQEQASKIPRLHGRGEDLGPIRCNRACFTIL